MIDAGKLNKLVMLQKKSSTTKDTAGKKTVTWENVCKVWCQFMDSRGREFMAAKQANAKVTHMLKIRYLSTVTNEWRATYGSEVFNFDAVINTKQADEELVITAIVEAA